jgi:predicted RNA polymerase sigma factor
VLQAEIAACHARARTAADTDWPRISELYEELWQVNPSPIVALNRAVAVGMSRGPEAGLALTNELTNERALETYHLFPAVRGDFFIKLGRFDEAQAELERAASLTRNERERALLLARAAACARETRVDTR